MLIVALCAVICTLGPASRSVDTLVEMLNVGMTAARVDLTVHPDQPGCTVSAPACTAAFVGHTCDFSSWLTLLMTLLLLQWGPPEYHVQSLRNLKEAMQRTKRLCATIVDTVGAHHGCCPCSGT